jgi:hypothetical protein
MRERVGSRRRVGWYIVPRYLPIDIYALGTNFVEVPYLLEIHR